MAGDVKEAHLVADPAQVVGKRGPLHRRAAPCGKVDDRDRRERGGVGADATSLPSIVGIAPNQDSRDYLVVKAATLPVLVLPTTSALCTRYS
jgi:hypothetical protein